MPELAQVPRQPLQPNRKCRNFLQGIGGYCLTGLPEKTKDGLSGLWRPVLVRIWQSPIVDTLAFRVLQTYGTNGPRIRRPLNRGREPAQGIRCDTDSVKLPVRAVRARSEPERATQFQRGFDQRPGLYRAARGHNDHVALHRMQGICRGFVARVQVMISGNHKPEIAAQMMIWRRVLS